MEEKVWIRNKLQQFSEFFENIIPEQFCGGNMLLHYATHKDINTYRIYRVVKM